VNDIEMEREGETCDQKRAAMEVDSPSPAPEDKCGFDSSPDCIDLVNYRRPETSAWIAKEAVAYWESLDDTSIGFYFSSRYGFLSLFFM
jgi:hypothetical protein